jgi:hypothetical protein
MLMSQEPCAEPARLSCAEAYHVDSRIHAGLRAHRSTQGTIGFAVGNMMRCLLCGAEMRLEEEAEIKTVPVSEFQRCTFKCSVCGDVEQRLLLHTDVESLRAEAAPLRVEMVPSRNGHPERQVPSETPISPPPAAEYSDAAAPSLARHVFSKLARISRVVVGRLSRGAEVRSAMPDVVAPAAPAPSSEPPSGPDTPPTSPGFADAVSAPEITPTVVFPADEAGECEDLLRRAIKLLHVTTPSSQDSISGPDFQPATQESLPAVESAGLPSALPEPGLAVAVMDTTHSEADLVAKATPSALPVSTREAESPFPTVASNSAVSGATLAPSHSELERAAPVAASNSPSVGAAAPSLAAGQEPTASATSLAKTGPEIPTEVVRSPRPERSASKCIVVHIQYDSAKSKYVAIDINTGFPILRHHDGARLREMCDRMNLQVVEGEASNKGYWSEASRNPPPRVK